MNWRVPLSDLDFGPEEERAVQQVVRGRWLSMGEETQRFEAEFAEFIGCKHAIAVTNATAALHLACLAAGLKPTDEVMLPSLTFVATANAVRYVGAIPVFWVSADMTENNLGHIDPGDRVAIVLDIMPGVVLKGRVRSVGAGVGSGQQSQPGTLPTIENSRDWLRQAQRIPVAIEFDPAERWRLTSARIGGQAEVLVYTGDNPVMNFFGAVYIRLMSWLSYLY